MSSTFTMPPALTVKLAPANWYRSEADRLWAICNCLGKRFCGLYFKPEIAYISNHFAERTGLIEPREFDPVAAAAMAWFTNGRAAQ